jgi:hypothetical protein
VISFPHIQRFSGAGHPLAEAGSVSISAPNEGACFMIRLLGLLLGIAVLVASSTGCGGEGGKGKNSGKDQPKPASGY